MNSDRPIIILDSGLGGLTVVRAIRRSLPNEHLLYFGDTARLPYGSKSARTVTLFVRQIITWLLPHRPKHVVIACNTATALALPAVRQAFGGLPISGVIEPGARAAVAAPGRIERPVIGIIATEATIQSRAYEQAIHRRRQMARLLLRPTPLLVPIIEDGRPGDDPLVQLALEQYLRPMINRGLHVLLLGCTHYPLLREPIQKLVGPNVCVIDSAAQCAQDVAQRLAAAGLLRSATGGSGSLKCFVTDDSPRFRPLAERFLGFAIDNPVWVCPEELHRIEPHPLRQAG
jgi:glutamate racemase